MESCLTFLEGSRTHARYDADVLQTLDPVDGAPLLARYDLDRVARTMTSRSLSERPGPGMWRFAELMPVRDRRHLIHLGEGSTPLLSADRLGAALGIDTLLVKAEGLNPTGSFKARGMAAAVSRARELGARSLIAPSAGNAGGALAAYGAAAGLPVTVVVPADTPTVNVVEAQVCGATVLLVDGFISDCGRVSKAIAAITGAFDVSTLKEPYRVEGKKTMGLELAEQLGWAVPDVIVYPTGGGTGLVGMWKAFDELESLGFIGRGRPRMVSAQAAGCAPMVRAFHAGEEAATPWEDPETRASGLRVPGAVGDRLILSALRESEGTAVAVPEEEIDRVQRLVGRRGMGYVAPESATAFAAVAVLADDGWVSANERVVVFDCGIGHKYPPPPGLGRPSVVTPDIAEDEESLREVLRSIGVARVAPAEGARPTPPSPAREPGAVLARAGGAAPVRAPQAVAAPTSAAAPPTAPAAPPAPATLPPPATPTPAAEPASAPPLPVESASAQLATAGPVGPGVGPRVPGEAPNTRSPAATPAVPGEGMARVTSAVPGSAPTGAAPVADVSVAPVPVAAVPVAHVIADVPTTELPPVVSAAAEPSTVEISASEIAGAMDPAPGGPDEGGPAAQSPGGSRSRQVDPLPKPPFREIVVHPLPSPPR